MDESSTNKTNWGRGLHRIFYVLCVIWLLWWVIVTPFKMQAASMEFKSAMYGYALKDCYSGDNWNQGYSTDCSKAADKKYLENKGVQGIYLDAITKSTASDIASFFSLLIIPPLILYGLIRLFVWLVLWIVKGFA